MIYLMRGCILLVEHLQGTISFMTFYFDSRPRSNRMLMSKKQFIRTMLNASGLKGAAMNMGVFILSFFTFDRDRPFFYPKSIFNFIKRSLHVKMS